MRRYVITILMIVLFPAIIHAESGIIIEASGDVSITAPSGGEKEAKAGSVFPHGSKIEAAKKGGAVILFKNGALRRLGSKERVYASGRISGETLFFQEMIDIEAARSADKGDPSREPKKKREPVDPEEVNEKALKGDLKRAENCRLSTKEGKALLKGEVLFKYRKYNDVINVLAPVCHPSSCQSEAARNLLKVSFAKTGNAKQAAQY